MADEIAPVRGRPLMQNYGISEEATGLLRWDWVDAQMASARNYWVCSTRPDRRPHAAPVWGVWVEGTFYFGTGRTSRKGRNLLANPAVVIHLESGDDTVIVEGTVEEVTDRALRKRVYAVYAQKYGMSAEELDPEPETSAEPGNLTLQLKPQVALAWKEADFPNTATRWQF